MYLSHRICPVIRPHSNLKYLRLSTLNKTPSLLYPSSVPISRSAASTMSTYKGETAPAVSSQVASFYEKFYAVSDNSDPSTHTQYADAFTKDATFIMGPKKVAGYDDILELRKGLWSGPVVKRLHTLERIYSFGDDGKDVMLYGNVQYGLKNGKDCTVDWAGRAKLVEEGGDLKMKFYQVYLDSSVVANAMKE